MGSILVRYAEIGLKSRSVRRRFESILIDNLMSSLAYEGIEGLVSSEYGRIFIEVDDAPSAISALSRVFGVASVSPVLRCSSDMEEMKKRIAELSVPLIEEGQSFAVRARRIGNHPFTSVDLGRELGSAVYVANERKGIRVDLTNPDLEIFVEVREKKAYLFHTFVPGPGGLPLGSQGRVVALLEKESDALAAWLIMKRGCKTIALGSEDSAAVRILRSWDHHLKVLDPADLSEAVRRYRAHAAVFGLRLADFERIKGIRLTVPAFFPLIGMGDSEINIRLQRIKAP